MDSMRGLAGDFCRLGSHLRNGTLLDEWLTMNLEEKSQFCSFQAARVAGISLAVSGLGQFYNVGRAALTGAYLGGKALVQSVGKVAFSKTSGATATRSIARQRGWVLPEGGGGALINSRWYTEHSLERMAPNTPHVMATLEARTFERSKAIEPKLSPKELAKWFQENAPNPRGVPPSVVEAEIANPGSTGVRVILNKNGDVITVIPGG
jgi:hypothetical protein